jgi:Kef-type K+ transport system membrane component KefB
MNEVGSVGVILLLALLAGHLAKWFRVPEVTGYILAGVALGPSVLGWVGPENLSALQTLSDVALGLILFALGMVFELENLRSIGRQLTTVTLTESATVFVMVTVPLLLLNGSVPVALLLGVMAMETAAATTLMVLRETNATGPVTSVLTGVLALDNLLCLVAFNTLVAVLTTVSSAQAGGQLLDQAAALIWQILGSAALGYVVGFLLTLWSARVVEHGEQLILLAGCVLLCVGLAGLLNLSSLVTNLAVGATVVNLSQHSRSLLESLGRTDPPLYAIFFVLAGAELNLSVLASMGMTGAAYVALRVAGKVLGTWWGARRAGLGSDVQKYLPFAMLPQAGLAIGLLGTLQRRVPEYAAPVMAVILASVILFEMVGPLGVRWTIRRAGEEHPDAEPALTLWTEPR